MESKVAGATLSLFPSHLDSGPHPTISITIYMSRTLTWAISASFGKEDAEKPFDILSEAIL